MLEIKSEEVKSINDRLSEAMMKIPLYTDEWTNFNPSDPGITTLESLLYYSEGQEMSAGAENEETRLALMKLTGFLPKPGKCSRVLLSTALQKKRQVLPKASKFSLGDMCFETKQEIVFGERHLLGVYGEKDGEDGGISDYGYLTDDGVPVPITIFSDKPKTGMRLYFVCDSFPEEKKDFLFYFTLEERYGRTPFSERNTNAFSDILWEIYTKDGFREISARDYTAGLVTSGEIRFRMPENVQSAEYDGLPQKGYVLRATLKRADYDMPPKMLKVDGFLIEAWQKDTRARALTFQNAVKIDLYNDLSTEPYLLIFGKEEKGSSYRRYLISYGEDGPGRYVNASDDNGNITIEFDQERYGMAPGFFKDAVKVVLYSEEIMNDYRVGRVLGCDHQVLKLPLSNIVAESFCLLAKRPDGKGDFIFDFVRAGKSVPGGLQYKLLERSGNIVIEDAGDFIGADLFIAQIAVTRGVEGNIRARSKLRLNGIREPFIACAPGNGGVFAETAKDVRKRFVEDLQTSSVCVTEKDYENIVMSTPGLCIARVRAFKEQESNTVRIAVLQAGADLKPALTPLYKSIIKKRIDERRMLSTRVELIGPAYLTVDVQISVRCKIYVDENDMGIREVVESIIDYRTGKRNFGEPLEFETIIRAVEALPSVDYVKDISVKPVIPGLSQTREAVLLPKANVLLLPGKISIERITRE
ncbi:MAG: baseplate J/gp47 family protein [Lachnospiraceae bacterium]|nr:baseplate J/gp47 family protein [Lachnospiraceae bacterium]